MTRRVTGLLAALTCLLALATPAHAATPGYVTLLFSRSPVEPLVVPCASILGSVPMDTTLAWLNVRGLHATGSVVVDDIADERTCVQGMREPSWGDLARWRDTYGLTVVSAGLRHDPFPEMTPEVQQQDSCGSLPALTDHGHAFAGSLFLPASGQITPEEQATTVAPCFSWTRTYGHLINSRSSSAKQFARAWGVTGGSCNDPAADCYTIPTQVLPQTRYDSPDLLRAYVRAGADQWAIVQTYALVTGRSALWDCTSPDWRQHWTRRPEVYCSTDWRDVVRSIPAGVRVVQPETVAEAWRP